MIGEKAVGIIGCGNMGSALAERLAGRPKALFVFDKDQNRQVSLIERLQLKGCRDIKELISNSEIIIIAVKPQDIDAVLEELKGAHGKSIISIAAGITRSYLASVIGDQSTVIRAMPNLNAVIGRSSTGLNCAQGCRQTGELNDACEIFELVGEVVLIEGESQMDMVTAVAGSGPAFVAYLSDDLDKETIQEVMINEAVKYNMEEDIAERMVGATIEGTLEMLRANMDADTLIKRVSSKGGTTEAGMRVFQRAGKTPEALAKAIRAASKRAGELSKRG